MAYCEITPSRDWRTGRPEHRLNAVSPYFTMFPLSFPGQILESARPGDWVLDPFCGRGTTLFAARSLGLNAVGIDTNPVAVATSRAKLVSATADEVVALARHLVDDTTDPPIPHGEFWERCYHPTTLRAVASIRHGLLHAEPAPAVDLLRAIMLGILHGPLRRGAPSFLSNQMPRTYATKPGSAVRYWAARQLEPPYVDVLDVIRRRAAHVLAQLPPPTHGEVLQGDARELVGRLQPRFSWVITSPPYLGRDCRALR